MFGKSRLDRHVRGFNNVAVLSKVADILRREDLGSDDYEIAELRWTSFDLERVALQISESVA
jgi:hypothetical protein